MWKEDRAVKRQKKERGEARKEGKKNKVPNQAQPKEAEIANFFQLPPFSIL